MKVKDLTDNLGMPLYGDLSGKTYNGGTMDLYKKGLTSLEGSPDITYSDFWCDSNKIKTLKGGPKQILLNNLNKFSGVSFSCSENPNLESLEGAPKLIEGSFFCRNNPKLIDPIGQIVKYQIKANKYYYDGGHKDGNDFYEIQELFNSHRLEKGITSKGFRTLLGLKK